MGATGAILGVQTLLGVADSYNQYQANKAEETFNNAVYDINTRTANLQAEDAITRGQEDANRIRRETKIAIGQQRASQAGQGVDVNTGTGTAIREETRSIGAIEAINIKNNAFREALGYKTKANNLQAQKAIARITGKFQRRSIILGGGLRAGAGAFRTGKAIADSRPSK